MDLGQDPREGLLAFFGVWTISKQLRHWLRHFEMVISKWPRHWIYYNLHVYISHRQVHFVCIKTYQVFLSIANSTGIVTTYSSITGVPNRLTTKTQNLSFLCFLLSFFVSFFLSLFPSFFLCFFVSLPTKQLVRDTAVK